MTLIGYQSKRILKSKKLLNVLYACPFLVSKLKGFPLSTGVMLRARPHLCKALRLWTVRSSNMSFFFLPLRARASLNGSSTSTTSTEDTILLWFNRSERTEESFAGTEIVQSQIPQRSYFLLSPLAHPLFSSVAFEVVGYQTCVNATRGSVRYDYLVRAGSVRIPDSA